MLHFAQKPAHMCVAEALKGHGHAFADAPSRIRSTLSKRFEDTALPLREKSSQPHRTANGQKLALSVGRESLSVKLKKCSNWALVPSSATTLTNSRLALGPGNLDSFSKKLFQSASERSVVR